MQLNSTGFWIFFFAVFCVYYRVRPRLRWIVLLAASLLFYAKLNAPHLLIALALVTGVSYIIGRLLAGTPAESAKRRGFLWLGILLNLGVLFFIRFLPVLIRKLPDILSPWLNLPEFMVSVGVSFYVFQAISYIIDIYYEDHPAELHFGYFSLYICFFPKLLQGPIERASNLLPQLHSPKALDDEMIRSALLLFAWGLFKKVVIADRLSILVGAVYNDLPKFTGISLWLATFYYAVQIYCDFSGYTDMAIGAARLLGVNLASNFNKPYFAVSIADFWRRWHISFSTWIFDYIFKPLQMNLRRLKTWANPIALLITFFLSGIWHGSSWGFVIWGLLHGIYLAVYSLVSPYEKRMIRRLKLENSIFVKGVRICITFLLVCFAWIFFRTKTPADGWYVVSHLFTDLNRIPGLLADLVHARVGHGLFIPVTFDISPVEHILVALGLIILLSVELPKSLARTRMGMVFNKYRLFRWFVYCLLCISILVLGTLNPIDFVYSQF